MPPAMNVAGMRFGRLLVQSRAGMCNGRSFWNCLCDCGKTTTVTGKHLKNGGTKSCGCLHVEHAMHNVKSLERPIGYRRVKKQNGRVEVKTERGFSFEHVHVMETYLGGELRHGAVVHHIDGDTSNNDISNLAVMSNAAHTRLHNLAGRGRSKPTTKRTEKSNHG